MELKEQLDISGLKAIVAGILNRPVILIAIGAVMIAAAAFSLFGSSSDTRDSDMALEQGRRAVSQLHEPVESIRRLLEDEQVQSLAAMSMAEGGSTGELDSYVQGRVKEVKEIRIYPPDSLVTGTDSLGESAYIILDMIAAAKKDGQAPVQLIKLADSSMLAGLAVIGEQESPAGFVMLLADDDLVLESFDFSLPEAGYISLVQSTGGTATVTLREFGQPDTQSHLLTRLTVPGSLFRVVIPQAKPSTGPSNFQRLVFFLVGGLLLAFGLIRRQVMQRKPVEFKPDPEAISASPVDDDDEFVPTPLARADAPPTPDPEPETQATNQEATSLPALHESAEGSASMDQVPDGAEDAGFSGEENAGPEEEVDLAELHYELEQRKRPVSSLAAPVELVAEIFRAYDIRGVVGKTLDAGVARQIGQAVGSLALDREASPVVVGRDGRHSGPKLVDGIIEGLTAAGCDVIDVGAVPTGVLYWAAYELGAGSGVMVTGSHNPPDYNGFKVMIGGDTLSGDAITSLYDRIEAGNLRVGKGEVSGEEVLKRYIDRIAGDIQLERPLKVVADCGNGIGGICASEVLQAIGAKVFPLYDEVNGDFPNHHPDPSDPANLDDLIGTVKAMEADIGVAFDGDADRLGVVTPAGRIIYADRLMMLFAPEVLSRNPDATIIYDVKCTGHLADVISNAGGQPEMYKTGHSLIKNRMKEIDSPFAGEMSGHFFFKDRWYGFDCGIYAAARLLEILAADERETEEVMRSLPDSVSTPELKVEMEEGENHEFIARFQEEASFLGAEISKIDGLRADFDGGWGLVRASNTTPILVLRFDADSEEDLKNIQEAFRVQMLAVRGDLELPF